MDIVIIILLTLSTFVLGFSTINLLRKNEAYEDVVEEQEVLISDIAAKIDSSMARMKELDKLGSFEADDETGFIFKNLYEIIEELENYYGSQEEE
jgi:hypothetical protein